MVINVRSVYQFHFFPHKVFHQYFIFSLEQVWSICVFYIVIHSKINSISICWLLVKSCGRCWKLCPCIFKQSEQMWQLFLDLESPLMKSNGCSILYHGLSGSHLHIWNFAWRADLIFDDQESYSTSDRSYDILNDDTSATYDMEYEVGTQTEVPKHH